ncbi:hypothetical protein [Mesorhizobium sp. WSM4313]|uniref:hypothetical protein n=1 Tax=Mesorhizobium sp. WSM4313 TaxID=2029412 RepID=UPI000BB00AB3|nr:hypothetical protein [Mesorhizobium sp. WSM4313]PBB21365.1 hypothetical protein CK219_01820 [Mesorhizobium sp. WSM4313]
MSILLPAIYFNIDFKQSDFTKATTLFQVEPGNAGIFMSECFTDKLEGILAKVGTPVWSADLGDAGTFSIVVRQRTFDPITSLPMPVTLPNRAIFDPDQVPIEETPVKTGFRALLYNDPVAEGALRVLDVGGVTLSKPARLAT